MTQKSPAQKQAQFTAYYAEYYNEFFRYACYFLGNREDAEDAVSEALIAAFRSFESLRSEDKFKQWFLKILQNVCKTSLRNRVKKPISVDDDPDDIRFASRDADYDGQTDLRKALGGLKPEDKSIILLSVEGGYSSDEIAEMMSMSAVNVRVRMHRAFSKLREALC